MNITYHTIPLSHCVPSLHCNLRHMHKCKIYADVPRIGERLIIHFGQKSIVFACHFGAPFEQNVEFIPITHNRRYLTNPSLQPVTQCHFGLGPETIATHSLFCQRRRLSIRFCQFRTAPTAPTLHLLPRHKWRAKS